MRIQGNLPFSRGIHAEVSVPLGMLARIFASIAVALQMQACTTVHAPQRFVERSYAMGVEEMASPGEHIFCVRLGKRYEASVFVGLLYGGSVRDTWEQEVEEHELVFEGVEGSGLGCSYRHSTFPAKEIEIKSRCNPHVNSPFDKVSPGTATNSIKHLRLDIVSSENRRLSYAGVEIEILELTPVSLRFQILSDPFGETKVSSAASFPLADSKMPGSVLPGAG